MSHAPVNHASVNHASVNHAPETITTAFERAAVQAKHAEDIYRKQAATEIARLEAERLRAFRRVRLISILESAARATATGEDIYATQHRRLCHDLGWSGQSEAQVEVLDRLYDVCRAVQPQAAPATATDTVQARLEVFEQWFLAHRKASFYALFDIYVQETPVVDF